MISTIWQTAAILPINSYPLLLVLKIYTRSDDSEARAAGQLRAVVAGRVERCGGVHVSLPEIGGHRPSENCVDEKKHDEIFWV